jgi:hypothetical protein
MRVGVGAALIILLSGCLFEHEEPVAALVLDPFKVSSLARGESFEGQLAGLQHSVTFATRTRGYADGALFVSDGIVTNELKRFESHPRGLAAVGTEVMFVASADEQAGIWITDGTVGGTRFIASIIISDLPPDVRAFVSGGRYYAHIEATNTLFTSDGTWDGTQQVLAGATEVGQIGDRIVALTTSPVELWVSGAPGQLTQFATLPETESGCIGFWELPDALYFSCSKGHLWRTDGTAAGTYQLADHGDLTVLPRGAGAGELFYVVFPKQQGETLGVWRTSGAANDSHKLFDFDLNNVVELGGRTLLGGRDGLWTLRSDGTRALLHGSYDASNLFVIDDLVLFASASRRGDALARSDGTKGGFYATHSSVQLNIPHGFVRHGKLVYFRSFNEDETCRPHLCADLWAITLAELHDPS